MSATCQHHRELTNGVGKCSKPMWCGYGEDGGFCDEPAYGPQEPSAEHDGRGGYWENGRFYSYYVPFLACYRHGGPKAPDATNPQMTPAGSQQVTQVSGDAAGPAESPTGRTGTR